jgi:hypothetical protein
VAIIAYTLSANPSLAEPIERRRIEVRDGDTVRVDGVRMRLAACDAPEIGNAGCDREREWGERSAARLRALLKEADRIEMVDTGRRDRNRRPLVRCRSTGATCVGNPDCRALGRPMASARADGLVPAKAKRPIGQLPPIPARPIRALAAVARVEPLAAELDPELLCVSPRPRSKTPTTIRYRETPNGRAVPRRARAWPSRSPRSSIVRPARAMRPGAASGGRPRRATLRPFGMACLDPIGSRVLQWSGTTFGPCC